MSYYNRNTANVEWATDGSREHFAAVIEDMYGFRSRHANDLYLDSRTGFVFCGSAYVCKVDRSQPDSPLAATDWTDAIGALDGSFPRNPSISAEGRYI